MKYMDITEEHTPPRIHPCLTGLTASAPHELWLKGSFPEKDYKDLILATQAMLDTFNGIAVMIARDPHANRRDTEIVAHTQGERKDLCTRISHLFYILAIQVIHGYLIDLKIPFGYIGEANNISI